MVAGTGALGWRANAQGVFSTGEGPAYAAWDEPATELPEVQLVQAAVLASNAHNTQPWLFDVGQDSIELYVDQSRSTDSIDPFRREQMISLGCALENMVIAANPLGLAVELSMFPDPADQTLVARLGLTPKPAEPSVLFEMIPERHMNRAAFDSDRSMSAETIAEATALVNDLAVTFVWIQDSGARQAFSDLTVAATEAIISDTEQAEDSFAWWRGDWDELQEQKDGITMDASGKSSLIRTLGKMAPAMSREQNDSAWLDSTREPQLSTAPQFGLICATDHMNPDSQIATGRAWQRLHLWATSRGLAMQPLNQTVERRDREEQLGLPPEIGAQIETLVGDSSVQAMMPFRIGYPKEKAFASPRRPASDVMLTTE